jgi:hypothetical protein
MTVTVATEGSGRLAYDIVGVASAANAGQGSIANPFGESVHIVRAHLLVKTQSGGAANLSIGITTVAAAATDVLNADAMNDPTEGSVIECFADPGAQTVLPTAVWTAAKFLTFTASATMVDFTGTLYLDIVRTLSE